MQGSRWSEPFDSQDSKGLGGQSPLIVKIGLVSLIKK